MTAERRQIARPMPQAGTRRGNASGLVLDGIDGRTTVARRFREIFAALGSDLGGELTAAQEAIAARSATLAVWCEAAEADLAAGRPFDLSAYNSAANTLRRLLATLGLERRTRDVTDLHDYLSQEVPAGSAGFRPASGRADQGDV